MKFKSKSLISIILSIMMVISMILVAIPANAAVIDSEPVGDGTTSYYLWYGVGTDSPSDTWIKKNLINESGSVYSADWTVSEVNKMHTFIVSTNSSKANDKDSSYWTSSKKPSIVIDETYKSTYFNYIESQERDVYGIVKFEVKYGQVAKMKLTFNSSDGTITISEAGSTPQKYNITSAETSSGTFNVNKSTAAENETVTITASPNTNYEVDAVTVTKTDGTETVSVTGSGKSYTFTMPAYDVTVNVTFKESATPVTSYYIGGRFKVNDSGGTEHLTYDPTGNNNVWNASCTDINFKFIEDSSNSGWYYLNTNLTVAELSAQLSGKDSNGNAKSWYPYFLIHTGSGDSGTWYGAISDRAMHSLQNTNALPSAPNLTLRTSQNEEKQLIKFSDTQSTIAGNVTLHFNPTELKLYYTTDSTSTPGDFKIVDKTAANGKLTFSAPNKADGTASAGDEVTVTATPDDYFECKSISVSYKDNNKVAHNIDATKTAANTFTFAVPSGLTKADIKDQEISVTGTFVLTSTGKADYIKDQGDGLWIDVAPDKNDTTATLIKWNNYYGKDQDKNRNPYTFYVPKNVDLTNAKVYNGYNSDVVLNSVTIHANSCNTAPLNIPAGTYSTSGATSESVKVMQGSTNAMFLHTTDNKGADYDLPTKIDSKYSTKSTVETSGGLCTTMVINSDATSTVSSAMKLESVKGRGNSSWEASYKLFGKYAFNMKLASKTKLFGMDNSKSWCLLANNADESMMRNALTYQLAKEIGIQDTPEFRFVDIYDNGEYLGSYLVTEKVDVGNSKLVKGKSFDDLNEDGAKAEGAKKVSENTEKSTYSYGDKTYSMQYAKVSPNNDTSDSTKYPFEKKGKYLLEFEIKNRLFPNGLSKTSSEASWFQSPQGQYVVVKSPEFATKEQVEFIATKFAAMEAKIFTSDATKAQLSTVMDVESFAKMYLIQEFSSNLDSAATSYYMTFDCAQTDPVFVANPVWDYDWAYGQYEKQVKKDVNNNLLNSADPRAWFAKSKQIGDNEAENNNKYSIQSQLATNNSEFKSVVRKVWEETNGFYDKIKSYYADGGQIDKWYDQIKDSVNMNEIRWGFIASDPLKNGATGNGSDGWGSNNTGDNHLAAVNYLKTDWTSTRATWLNEQFTSTTQTEYTTYTPDAPTIKLYAADGKTETSAVEQGKGFIIKVTSPVENNVVYRFFTSDGTQVGADQSDGILEIATDDLTVGETYKYKVQAVYNGKASADSATVSVTIDDKAGNKQVTIYFKSASASVYVPSLSVDGSTPAVMTREKKTTETNGTYFGSTYSGSLKFYWFFTKMTLDTSVAHTLVFTTKDNRVNAKTSYTFSPAEDNKYYFAVDNLMGDTNLIDLTGKDEHIRNYHISATHMVHSTTYDNNVGFTWINGKEWAMGTYISENVNTANLTGLTASGLLTIPSALNPNAMLQASSTEFFTIKSATLAQRISADMEEVSTLQYQLLDVNLDGVVDVKDSTMMQKALAGF